MEKTISAHKVILGNEAKLQSLKQQIKEGTYPILNPTLADEVSQRIASRMIQAEVRRFESFLSNLSVIE